MPPKSNRERQGEGTPRSLFNHHECIYFASSPALEASFGLEMDSNTSRKSAFEANATTRSQYVEQYLAKHQVLDVIQAALTKLAFAYKLKHELPANPYPGLLVPLRQVEQLQSAATGNTRAPFMLELASEPDNQQRGPELQVSTLKGVQPPIWGLRSSLERVFSPDSLSSSVRLLGKLFPSWTKDSELQDDGYAVTVFTALVGNCTVLPVADHNVLNTEQHVFVRGELLECAMELFAKQLLKFLHETKNPKADVIQPLGGSGIIINSAGALSQALYSIEDATSNRNAFTNAVKTALVSHGQFQSTSVFCVSKLQQQPLVINVENAFFFHFASSSDVKQQKRKPNAANRVTSNHSFLVGSRMQESGILLSSRAATSVTERLVLKNPLGQSSINSQTKSKPLAGECLTSMSSPSTTSPVYESTEMLESTLSSFQEHLPQRSTEIVREWSHNFTTSVAYALLCVVASNEMLLRVFPCVSSEAQTKSILRAQFAVVRERMSCLLERAKLATASSLFLGAETLIESAWHCAQEAVDNDGCPSSDCVEPLKHVNGLLMIIARAAVEDFKQLAKSQSEPEPKLFANSLPEHKETQLKTPHDSELVDVMLLLDKSATQKTYPPCILEEATFAQWLVDSCADIALENAVMQLVAFGLSPNAFVEVSGYLRVFALRQLVWNRSLVTSPLDSEQLCWHENDQICSIPWTSEGVQRLYSASPMLLRIVSIQRLDEWHEKLLELQIYRVSDYIPSKSSYSVQAFVSMQLFHPIVLAKRTIPQPPVQMHGELDIIEHLVVEGAGFDQALHFFADAVASDLQRIARMQWFAPVRTELLDPKGEHIAYVAVLEHRRESLLEVVREASAARCFVQVRIVHYLKQTPSAVVLVLKSYAFHHRPTDNTTSVACCLSDVVWNRLRRFGVFQSLESARLVLCGAKTASKPTVERVYWASYAQQAVATRDLFLMSQLELVVDGSYTQSDQIQLQRLVNHSSIVDLYNLVSHERGSLLAYRSLTASRRNQLLDGFCTKSRKTIDWMKQLHVWLPVKL